MIAIILAGGYAKRLWPLTLDKPKALLPVAGKTAIDYVIKKVLRLNPPVSKIIILTNLRFQSQFDMWLESKGYGNVELVPDNSMNESEKVGAVKALCSATSNLDEDFLVIAGDSLFADELDGLVRFFDEKHSSLVALYSARDLDEARRGATVVLDDDRRVVEFIEKPVNPKTTLVSACLYAFPSRISTRLREYAELGLPKDEPGRFIEWLYRTEPVYGYILNDHLLDMGTPESYEEARKKSEKCAHLFLV